ncbi:HAMP domain-containing sensor histidine kinase [Streptomyces sp. NBC_00878]|uniref:sensor histidine kinase n=1 Tax=Streptomyces sp. NBC_00878 TaxID=2975854 RepID=UPI002258C83E|nr:HAMP domain-containing sensor histidine kinase [Streptomyces sp. NBC_00878]MCX4903943.1 HAMP domain-containing histidine kinase [Streptomyces sp. NBC_00878]
MNTAVFVVGGIMLLTTTWLSARHIIESNSWIIVDNTAATQAVPSIGDPSIGDPSQVPDQRETIEESAARSEALERFASFRDDVLDDLAKSLILILAVLAAFSLLTTLWIARRSLARIGKVTTAARHIGNENLDARLRLVGPDDEVKELADTFDGMLDRLERSFTDQRRFTAHASHELRTPLTLQRAALEIPLAHGRVPAELQPNMRRALAATDRCERLLASLLALARGESGVLQHRTVDLADLARTAVADVNAEAESADVAVHALLRPAPLSGDAPLLAQLVANLVTNGVRHNHAGGTVHVETGTDPSGDTRVTVSNTGPVIEAATLPALFEPFQRGTVRGAGAGLGLAVVRTVTSTHKGQLEAEPGPEGGLSVSITFPGSASATEPDDRPVGRGHRPSGAPTAT